MERMNFSCRCSNFSSVFFSGEKLTQLHLDGGIDASILVVESEHYDGLIDASDTVLVYPPVKRAGAVVQGRSSQSICPCQITTKTSETNETHPVTLQHVLHHFMLLQNASTFFIMNLDFQNYTTTCFIQKSVGGKIPAMNKLNQQPDVTLPTTVALHDF